MGFQEMWAISKVWNVPSLSLVGKGWRCYIYSRYVYYYIYIFRRESCNRDLGIFSGREDTEIPYRLVCAHYRFRGSNHKRRVCGRHAHQFRRERPHGKGRSSDSSLRSESRLAASVHSTTCGYGKGLVHFHDQLFGNATYGGYRSERSLLPTRGSSLNSTVFTSCGFAYHGHHS